MSELGDLFFPLICVANATDSDLETALSPVLIKYQDRQETGSGR
jgi:NTP pyrophosphatase (non-canonical NTP hydrolase)